MSIYRLLRTFFRGIRYTGHLGSIYFEMLGERHYLRERLTYDEAEFYLGLRPALRNPGLVVYDIGANIGVFSQCMAKVRNVMTVYAFEPVPDVFLQLRNNTQRFENIKCYNVACGDTNGRVTMFVNNSTPSSSLLPMAELHKEEFPSTRNSHAEEISVVRLDDFILKESLQLPNLVKIDVQGFEDRVLRGGELAIGLADWCVLEMSLRKLYEGGLLSDEVHAMMRSLGFRLTGFVSELKGRKSGYLLVVDGLYRNERRECVGDLDCL